MRWRLDEFADAHPGAFFWVMVSWILFPAIGMSVATHASGWERPWCWMPSAIYFGLAIIVARVTSE